MTRRWMIAVAAFALAGTVRADDRNPNKLPLDVLLETPISTAAKYDQQMSHVAASVTTITAEEIERYGWTSLDEVLQSVRGFYRTYNRSEVIIGLRGIGRPNDQNERFLLLLDGMTVNDSIFGGAPLGNTLALDLGTVERIEIVRGPGSALYGSHAMLAVINIISKSADSIDGVSVSAIAGSHGETGASLRGGRTLANGLAVTLSGHWQEDNGANLYFPEFDTPATNHGVAEGRDFEDLHSFAVGLQKGNFRLDASTRSRSKGLPTGAYETLFNSDTRTRNERDLLAASYHRKLGWNKTLEVRAYWDRGRYVGAFDNEIVRIYSGTTRRMGGEARMHWDIRPNHRLTIGAEYCDNQEAYFRYTAGDYNLVLDQPDAMKSYYLQYEGHPSPFWGFVAGVRHDDASAVADSTNPRAGILFTPNRNTTVKLLYGQAFRTANLIEANYSDLAMPGTHQPQLAPEAIRTSELALEQRLSRDVFAVGSVFHVAAFDLIDQGRPTAEKPYVYRNVGELESNGLEMSVHLRRQDGLWARFSGSLTQATRDEKAMSNSPAYLLKAGVSNAPAAPLHFGLDAIFEAARRTRNGEKTDSFFLLNASFSRALGQRLRMMLTARNLLNLAYATPVGEEMLAQSLRQDGRTLTLKLTYTH